MIDPRLGVCARAPLTFQFERFDESVRVLLVNADESGSMQGRTDDNLLAYDRVAATLQGRADVVIVHGFESDSHYELVHSEAAASRLRLQAGAFAGLDVTLVPSGHPVARGRELLAAHKARGSTNPRSHPRFLDALRELLEAAPGVTVELAVLSSSDGASTAARGAS